MKSNSPPRWRAIPVSSIDWRLTISHAMLAGQLMRLCRASVSWSHPWSDLTLGELADMGERGWRVQRGVGAVGVEGIKRMIDRAAAGERVIEETADVAYKPRRG